MLRPLLLVLLIIPFWGGGALADGPWTAWDNYTAAVRGAVQGSTLDEVIQWSDRQFARRAVVGRYVRWGGAILIGSALIAAGLDYFYNYLRRETGTSLDTWYYWRGIPDPEWPNPLRNGVVEPLNFQEIWRAIERICDTTGFESGGYAGRAAVVSPAGGAFHSEWHYGYPTAAFLKERAESMVLSSVA